MELKDLITKDSNSEYNIYDVGPNGTAIGFRLIHDNDIAVQKIFLSRGAKVPIHSHIAHEWIIVYKGVIKVRLGPKDTDIEFLSDGSMLYIPPATPHSAEVDKDCWVLATTIPPDKGYP